MQKFRRTLPGKPKENVPPSAQFLQPPQAEEGRNGERTAGNIGKRQEKALPVPPDKRPIHAPEGVGEDFVGEESAGTLGPAP